MRGPLFKTLLPKWIITRAFFGESISDLESMYSIIIEERGKTEDTLTKFDEQLALAALCKIAWPGKVPGYTQAIQSFKRRFRGIARSVRLQQEFRSRIGRTLSTARTANDISFDRLSSVFESAEATSENQA